LTFFYRLTKKVYDFIIFPLHANIPAGGADDLRCSGEIFSHPARKFQRLLSQIRSKCLLTNFSIFLDKTKATACSSTHNRSTLARSFPRRSKDAGQGSIGLAAVGLGIWLGHWPHVSHSSAMHQSSGRSRTSVRTLSAHARLCDTSNARGNEKEPKFPGGRASISEPQFPPGGPEAPPSVRCSDVQSAQSCAHSPRCSRSIAASSPICLQSRVETVHAEQNISLPVALIFSKIFFQWLAKRYRQPCAVQYSNQLCPEQLGLDVKGRNPILRIFLWCSTDYENR